MRLSLSLLVFAASFSAFAEEPLLVPLPEIAPLQQELIVPLPKVIEVAPPLPPVKLPPAVKICSNDFAKALNDLEISARLPLLETMNAVKKQDASLNIRRLLMMPEHLNGKDWGEAMRLTRLIAQGNGVDPALYTTAAVGDIVYRSTHELKGYTTQYPSAGICAGVSTYTGFYKDRNAGLFLRRDLYQKLRGMIVDEIKREKPDFAYSLPELLNKDKRDALFIESFATPNLNALANMLAWLSEGQSRVGLLADKFEAMMEGIVAAHKTECVCSR